jgi:diamine N-acetyltransferase
VSAGFTLRQAGIEDAEALAVVGAATFLDTFAGLLSGDAIVAQCSRAHAASAYAMLLAQGARAWLAEATDGEAPIGYALVTEPDLPGASAADIELKRIYSLSRFHGQGIGSALLTAAIRAAAGRDRLVLGVYRGNARALAFYRKQGFEQIATRRFDVGGTLYDDVVLARPLGALSTGFGSAPAA